ncbi:fimbrial biogenesis outer membrane usher protein [Trinickia terrae]|uniref:Fimbrial biogenesis outer membrane usher protein n=1 Tax=Trinickia terrae TaxID=2571161 RepID=A0A4U1I7X6_9BURK|nr:fimbria/pilus outer membrane usher protein [Trinickia terrae]TKC89355.1 fimbrial biogenesis outer membrane usher protein [Trinickia terrae]
MASGGWALSADAWAAECGPATSRESVAGDCTELAQIAQPAGDVHSSSAVGAANTETSPVTATRAPDSGAQNVVQSAPPQEVEFNPAFFTGNVADLSRFTRGNPVSPGTYPVDVSINGKGRGRYDVKFQAVPGSDIAAPCFTLATMDRLGIDVERLIKRLKDSGKEAEATLSSSVCRPLAEAVPGSTASFNTADFQLDLTIPQLEMQKFASGYVDPSRWDEGINAAMLQYSLATYASHAQGADLNSAFLSLQSGINVGGWRLRQWSSANWQSRGAGTRWQSIALYAQHDITALKGQVTIGDSSTTGDVFDSFNVRGVQLSSDDRMLPDSVRSYAPVVRGVADTNARVTVRQNGIILYETTVSPGPFELSDVPPTGYGGDLDVTVTEADGRVRRYAVPFASVPQLLRPGVQRFNVTAGMYRDSVLNSQPGVIQGVYQRGLTDLLTVYTGGQVSAGYGAGLFGVALNTAAGAFALDVTVANTSLQSGGGTGYSGRVTYSKVVPGVRTNFAVAAYRYSTSRFYSLRDAIYARDQWGGQSSTYDYRARNRLQLNITQPLGDTSSLYVSGSSQDYWGSARSYDLQYQVGLSSVFKRVSYTLYAQRTRMQNSGINTQVGVNLSIPLGRADSYKHKAFDFLTTNMSRSSGGDSTIQATANGMTDNVTPINYNVSASRLVTGDNETVSLGGGAMYRSPIGTYTGNASIGNQTRQASFNADGAVVLHSGGVTLSPPLGQAFALVEAKGAKGGTIINGQGAAIDSNGYAVIPSLMPYRVNMVALDPSKIPLDVELASTSEEVVPRANSLVLVRMKTVQGRPTFAEVEDLHGKALPMGAELFDETGSSAGIVGQGGMSYLRGLEGQGKLLAKWGAGPRDQCVMPYDIPKEERMSDGHSSVVAHVKLSCDPSLIWAPPPQQASTQELGAGRANLPR